MARKTAGSRNHVTKKAKKKRATESNSNNKNHNDSENKTSERKPFRPNYDYDVDYNDHFETPLDAYTDILPLIDSVAPKNNNANDNANNDANNDANANAAANVPKNGTTTVVPASASMSIPRSDHVLYDPYYCNGRTRALLEGLGFSKVIHEKRDFYADVSGNTVPEHHTLVTNPPYSDDHKERCLEFCNSQFREKKVAFFLLIPSYVAARSYYRRILGDTIHDVAYVVPPEEYSYSHPEGTGHEVSPFASLWFCGIGRDRIREWSKQRKPMGATQTRACTSDSGASVGAYRTRHSDSDSTNNSNSNDGGSRDSQQRCPRFVASFDELVSLGIISLQNRPNPRQRKKKTMMMGKMRNAKIASTEAEPAAPVASQWNSSGTTTTTTRTMASDGDCDSTAIPSAGAKQSQSQFNNRNSSSNSYSNNNNDSSTNKKKKKGSSSFARGNSKKEPVRGKKRHTAKSSKYRGADGTRTKKRF